jgi:hypothetical protein
MSYTYSINIYLKLYFILQVNINIVLQNFFNTVT